MLVYRRRDVLLAMLDHVKHWNSSVSSRRYIWSDSRFYIDEYGTSIQINSFPLKWAEPNSEINSIPKSTHATWSQPSTNLSRHRWVKIWYFSIYNHSIWIIAHCARHPYRQTDRQTNKHSHTLTHTDARTELDFTLSYGNLTRPYMYIWRVPGLLTAKYANRKNVRKRSRYSGRTPRQTRRAREASSTRPIARCHKSGMWMGWVNPGSWHPGAAEPV